RILSSTTYIDKGGRPALLSLLPFQGVDFYGNYSFRYLWQKRLHFWSYSHHPFYLQRGALSIKHDLQTRPSTFLRFRFLRASTFRRLSFIPKEPKVARIVLQGPSRGRYSGCSTPIS